MCFLFASTLLFLSLVDGSLGLKKEELVLLLFALFSFFYIGVDGDFEIRYRIGLFLAFLVFLSLRLYLNSLSSRLLWLITSVNFAALIVHWVYPTQWKSIAIFFVRDIKITEFGWGRGPSGLAAEPSFMAAVFSIILLTWIWLFWNKRASSTSCWLGILLSATAIIITKSSTGGLALFIIFFIFFIFYLNLRLIALIGVIIIPSYLIAQELEILPDSRGLKVIAFLIKNPTTFFLLDTSIGERVVGIYFGFLAFSESIFGYGGGSYANIAPLLNEKYLVMNYFQSASEGVVRDQTKGNVTAFGTYIFEYGILYLLFLLFLFRQCISFNPLSISCAVLAFLYTLASFSILFPGVWFLLVLSRDCKKIKWTNNFKSQSYITIKKTGV